MRSLRSAALLALALLTPLAASGQMLRSSLEADSRALLFQIGPTLTPTDFDGSALSYKWHKSNTRAFRVGASFDGLYSDRTSTRETGKDQRVRGSLDLLLLTYRRGRTPVYFYYGYGPVVRGEFNTTFLSRNGPDFSTRVLRVGAGLAGVIGVEWPLNRVISLTGEYGVEAVGGIDERFLDGAERNGYFAEFVSRGGRAGISVYF